MDIFLVFYEDPLSGNDEFIEAFNSHEKAEDYIYEMQKNKESYYICETRLN